MGVQSWLKESPNFRWNSMEMGQFIWMPWHIVIWIFNYQKSLIHVSFTCHPIFVNEGIYYAISFVSVICKIIFGYAICLRHFKDPPRDTRCCLLQLFNLFIFIVRKKFEKSFVLCFFANQSIENYIPEVTWNTVLMVDYNIQTTLLK